MARKKKSPVNFNMPEKIEDMDDNELRLLVAEMMKHMFISKESLLYMMAMARWTRLCEQTNEIYEEYQRVAASNPNVFDRDQFNKETAMFNQYMAVMGQADAFYDKHIRVR